MSLEVLFVSVGSAGRVDGECAASELGASQSTTEAEAAVGEQRRQGGDGGW